MSVPLDIGRAIRSHARAPVLTATLVLTVAVGAGGNAAIFAFVGGLVTRDMSGPDAVDPARFARVAVLLVIACGLVLVLAAATVAGLLLSRASARTMETAVKVALGATRRRLARQALIDSLVVSIAGGAIGVLFAWWTMHAFPLLFFADDAGQLSLAPNVVWMGAAAGVWVVVMVLCGMAPALTVPQRDPALVLKRVASKSSNASRRFRTRLVVGQIALCSLLVVVAGVIREDLQATLRTSRGQVVGALLVGDVKAMGGGPAYLKDVQARARLIPGVTGTALVSTLPAGRPASQKFAIERPGQAWRDIRLDVTSFSPQGLGPDRVRTISGRMFGFRDIQNISRVALINKEAADRYFGGDALGRLVEQADGQPVQIIGVLATPPPAAPARPTLYFYAGKGVPPAAISADQVFHASAPETARSRIAMDVNVTSSDYFEIFADRPTTGRAYGEGDAGGGRRVAVLSEVGARAIFEDRAVGAVLVDPEGDRIEVVGVVPAEALGAAQKTAAPMLFMPLAQAYQPVMTLAMRAADSSDAFRRAVEASLRGVGGGELLTTVETIETHLVRTSLAAERIATTLVGVCAALALVLSLAGVYAVMADLVARRRRELALRIALGAGPWRLVGGVVREGLQLAAMGAAAGLAVSIVSAPFLGQIVVRPHLPGPIVLAAACLAAVLLVTLACAVPAWRAVCVDPRTVMHEE